jgi:hypothetical protein
MVVGVAGEVSQELYDVVGHQRGWEILTEGVQEPPLHSPPFVDFALALAGRAWSWPAARPCRRASARRSCHRSALQHARLPRDRRPPGRARPRAQDGDGVRGPLVAAGRARPAPGGPRIASPLVSAYSDPSLPATALSLRPRGHAGPAGHAHRSRACSRLHEQPADGGHLRRRPQRPLQGDRGRPGAADPMSNTVFAGGRPRLRPTSSARSIAAGISSGTHPVHRREPRELPHLGAQGLRDPRTASWAGSIATAASWPTRATTS